MNRGPDWRETFVIVANFVAVCALIAIIIVAIASVI